MDVDRDIADYGCYQELIGDGVIDEDEVDVKVNTGDSVMKDGDE